jgi:hypothetical protein
MDLCEVEGVLYQPINQWSRGDDEIQHRVLEPWGADMERAGSWND